MSPERERQFLLSVAASDALRLELKSHLMVDRILVDRVQSARVSETVRSTIFTAAGVSTGHAAPDAPSSSAPAADRAPAPRSSFFSRLSGRVTLVAAACAFFGAGYFVGNGGDALPADGGVQTSATVATSPATSGIKTDVAAEAPRIVTEQPSTQVAEPSTSRSGAGSMTARPSTRESRAAVAADGMTPSVTSPAVDAPSTTAPAEPRARNNRRVFQQQRVGVDASIDTPTQAERDQQQNTNPLQDGGTPVR
ncbi:MAG TPA: hypothetical protein VNA88_11665 [Candidatus Kapabacteria bacterium]|nr:hypothetical protein [Candidatus Kapabacteria bacterium]